MPENKYVDLVMEIKSLSIATVDENNHPQVRIIDAMFAENEQIYFLTARGKDFYRQILANPTIAITGMNKNFQAIRLNGNVKKVSQKHLSRIFAENPSMGDLYPGKSRSILDVFCLENATGEIFDLSEHPIRRESFALGNAQVKPSGYYISTSCHHCGHCQSVCPQNCIHSEPPIYAIVQTHCLHCGLCAEQCPIGAINKYTC